MPRTLEKPLFWLVLKGSPKERLVDFKGKQASETASQRLPPLARQAQGAPLLEDALCPQTPLNNNKDLRMCDHIMGTILDKWLELCASLGDLCINVLTELNFSTIQSPDRVL